MARELNEKQSLQESKVVNVASYKWCVDNSWLCTNVLGQKKKKKSREKWQEN